MQQPDVSGEGPASSGPDLIASPAGLGATRASAEHRFLFNVNLVFISQIAIYGLAFGLRVVFARALGDSGFGTYSLFFITVIVSGGVANLGVGLGNIYFLGKGDYSYDVLFSGSIFVWGVTSLVTWLVLAAYAALFGPQLFVSGSAYWLYAAALPAVVAYVLLTSLLHGSSRFFALSSVAVVQGGAALLAATAFAALSHLTVSRGALVWTGSFVVADLVALLLVGVRRIRVSAFVQADSGVLLKQIRYGAQGQVANLAQLFNYRLDQFLVAAFVSRAGVGHYTVAVGLAESVWWISSAVALVLLPRLTSLEREQADEVTPVISRNTVAVSILAALVLIAVAWPVIRIVFGREYDAALLPFILLMPGIIAASGMRVLASYLFSRGRVIYNTYATFIALGVTLALDLVLIRWLGVPGAAIASSVAYTASFLAILFWYRSVSGGSLVEALLVQRDDIDLYAGFARRLLRRQNMRRSTPGPAEPFAEDQPDKDG